MGYYDFISLFLKKILLLQNDKVLADIGLCISNMEIGK